MYVDAKLSVIRTRSVGDGFSEELSLINHAEEAVDLTLRIDAGADFADLFEVKDALEKKGAYQATAGDGTLVLSYEREHYHRETTISANQPAEVDEHGLTFHVRIEPKAEWSVELEVATGIVVAGGRLTRTMYGRGARRSQTSAGKGRGLESWVGDAPQLECDWDPLKRTYTRSLVDLAALRFSPLSAGGRSLPAAGLPWFMTMFGRDSILTSLQALPFTPELAATTLRELGARQGTRVDDFRDEDPGRILHEMRYGEMTAFEERPHSPYYGNADATPLFVVLLDEYERWTGDRKLVRELEYEARAALRWIDDYADLMGNGYVVVPAPQRADRSREPVLEGLVGLDLLPRRPPARVPARDLRAAGLRLRRQGARRSPRPAGVERLGVRRGARGRGRRSEAPVQPRLLGRRRRVLRARARRRGRAGRRADIEHRPPALERDRRRARRRRRSSRHLMGPRALLRLGRAHAGRGRGPLQPDRLPRRHRLAVRQLVHRLGPAPLRLPEEAARVAAGILDAAEFFDGRLPEAFGGYARSLTRYPVQYPTACSPQAWSTGAPLLFLRTMLGLEPLDDHLVVDPALPRGIGQLELLDIRGQWGRIDAFGRGRVDVDRRSRVQSQLGDEQAGAGSRRHRVHARPT